MDGTVDINDQAKFEAWADTWWDPEGPFLPLHRLNAFRTQWLLEHIGGGTHFPLADRRVLDIGCGGGLASEAMAKAGAKVVGIDVTERSIEVAKHHAAKNGLDIDYRCQTVEQHLREAPEPYDLVLNMEVVEHVNDLDAFLASCAQLTRFGGHQVIATINRNWISGFSAIFVAENVLKVLPKGTHEYSKLVKPKEVRDALEPFGFDDFAQAGVFYNPFTKKVSQTWHSMINYMLIGQRD